MNITTHLVNTKLKLAFEQCQACFSSVFSDPDGKGFSVPFRSRVVKVRLIGKKMHFRVPCKLMDGDKGTVHMGGEVNFRHVVSRHPLVYYDLVKKKSCYALSMDLDQTDVLIRFLRVVENCYTRKLVISDEG